MPKFSSRSKAALAELHPLLQKLLNEAIKQFDFVVLDAQRGEAEQMLAYRTGKSKVKFGNSPHNYKPAVACDIVPYPIKWNATKPFITMQMKIIKPLAAKLKIPIRQGLDWNRNGILTDENFVDMPHIELHPWREWAKKSKLIGK